MSHPAIGIDLGTTYSSIAVYKDGTAQIIPNEHGDRSMPSCVTFTPLRQFVGHGAIIQAIQHPESSIYGVKRIIGRTFDDPIVQEEIKNWPFKVIEDENKVKIEVEYKGERKRYSPEEISAEVLKALKKSAETVLETTIKDVVITCPANFNNSQREATMEAAKIAGLNVLRMINEPTAAALAYGLNEESTQNNFGRKNILVFDFGGGTCDTSILTIIDKKFEIRGTYGDMHLGGEDFDQRIVEYFVDEFKQKYNRDISKDNILLRQLKIHAENAKKMLSYVTDTNIIFEGTEMAGTISRPCFEDINNDLFDKAINLVDDALNNGEISKDDIDEVVLVGGSSKIPKVQEKFCDFFGSINLNKSVNQNETIALGAAIQAAEIQNQLSHQMKGLKLCEICPLSLGTDNLGGKFFVFIKRNTPIPVKETKTRYTIVDNQTRMHFKIYEGERKMARDNNFLGGFLITEIPPKPIKEVPVDVTFEVDENGILTVTASESSSGITKSINITKENRSDREAAHRVITDASEYREEDEKHEQRVTALLSFHTYLLDLRKRSDNIPNKTKVQKIINETLKWTTDYDKTATIEQIENKRKKFEALVKKSESQCILM